MILKLLLNTIWYGYKHIEEYNPNKTRKILIVVDDIFANMLSNKRLNSIVS